MKPMKVLLTGIVTSYALLGNIALAGVSIAASPDPALLAREVQAEANMTPLLSEDFVMSTATTPNISVSGERGETAALACTVEQRQAIRTLGARDSCPTDRCIVELEDQADGKQIALPVRGQEVISSVAIAPRTTVEEVSGAVRNPAGEREGRSLVAIITSSVIFRE